MTSPAAIGNGPSQWPLHQHATAAELAGCGWTVQAGSWSLSRLRAFESRKARHLSRSSTAEAARRCPQKGTGRRRKRAENVSNAGQLRSKLEPPPSPKHQLPLEVEEAKAGTRSHRCDRAEWRPWYIPMGVRRECMPPSMQPGWREAASTGSPSRWTECEGAEDEAYVALGGWGAAIGAE